MIHQTLEYISSHALYTPFVIFALIVLAGLNLPISLDLILVSTALLAATSLKGWAIPLYLSILIGSIVSAWVSYSVGFFLGGRLQKWSWSRRILPIKKMQKVKGFYEQYGLFSLIIGRFIPFGFRNCLFMSSGMSGLSFKKFALSDLFACTIWSASMFFLFLSIGENADLVLLLLNRIKAAAILVLVLFVIGLIWYKVKNKKTT